MEKNKKVVAAAVEPQKELDEECDAVNLAYNDTTAVMTNIDSREQLTAGPSQTLTAQPSNEQLEASERP